VLYCAQHKFLRAEFDLNKPRLIALCPDADVTEINEHLDAFARICEGGDDAGPIGKLLPGERFRWLTAPRSTVVQTSPVHTGLSSDVAETLGGLMTKMVR